MSSKRRFPAAEAMAVAEELVRGLQGQCARIAIAGSLRRRKADVGDIEIVFAPRMLKREAVDFFAPAGEYPATDAVIERWLKFAVIDKRLRADGAVSSWGPLNKHAVFRETGLSVDLFTATVANWWGYLVCRTGPLESNIRICEAARAKGWKYCPYEGTFSRGGVLAGEPEHYYPTSERDVFDFVGLPYLEPEARM